jgi:hypothetical protein
MARPSSTQTLEWATVGAIAGPSYSFAQGQAGWQTSFPPPLQWFNDWMNRAYLWQTYYDSANTSFYFGDGSDGSSTISTNAMTVGTWLSSGVLQRDVYLTNLTINGTGKIQTNGYRIFVNGTLDLTTAPAGAIVCNGGAGGNGIAGAPTTPGIAGTSISSQTIGGGSVGQAGTVAAQGTAGAAGMNGGASGAGGTSRSFAGGAAATVSFTDIRFPSVEFLRGSALIMGGAGGGSGAGGATTTGAKGGGGGGSGGGAGFVAVFAFTISRGASTAVGCITATGGVGGNGADASGAGADGGGGGGGGGGGWIYVLCVQLTGSAAANALSCAGGAGGTGGNGFTTGVGANAGNGGAGGNATVIVLGTSVTKTTGSAGGTGSVGAGNVGGLAGGAGGTMTASL